MKPSGTKPPWYKTEMVRNIQHLPNTNLSLSLVYFLYPLQNIVFAGYTVFSMSEIPSAFKVFTLQLW